MQVNLEDILLDKHSEEDLLEVPVSSRIFKILIIISAIVVVLILSKIFIIGVVEHDFYTNSAFANATQTDILQAPRGVIYDRFGDPLVKNEQAFFVFLSPRTLPTNPQERISALSAISSILNLDKEEFVDRVRNHDWRLGRFLVESELSHDKLVALSSENIPGLNIEPAFKRIYSHPYALSHVIGYTGLATKEDISSNPNLSPETEIGKSGLELFYDNILRGNNGQEITVFDSFGDIKGEHLSQEPESGADIKTFLDKDLQEFFYNRLANQVRIIGGTGAVGIVMNPQNGEILSLVSVPGFDNNEIYKFLNTPNSPLFNRAISGLYNPGSTIKPLVAVGALEDNVITPTDQIFSSGYLEVPNPYNPDQPSIFKDWKPHGWVNMYSALARSSNVYFYTVGGGFKNRSGLGIERLSNWWSRFMLDKKTGLDLSREVGGFLPSPSWKEDALGEIWRVGDTYNVSIGQGDFRITPIELLNYINAIANGGLIYRPRIADLGGAEIVRDLRNEVDSATWKIVQRGMIDAVEKYYGTASILSDLPISSAGKTGSAEVGKFKTNAFFVGYAPKEDPEVSILILVEEAKEGSLNAVPVARDVLLWYYNNRIK